MTRLARIILPLLICAASGVGGSAPVKIKLSIGDQSFGASLHDNSAARDFANMLPLTLQLEDYANTEKVADLPRKLSLADAPNGHTAKIGDITHYAPWGNLALFYKSFRHAPGLIPLGRLDDAKAFFAECKSSCTVKIEKQ